MTKVIDKAKIPPEALAKLEAKAANKPEPIDNTELIQQFRAGGGQVMHIRPIQRRISGWSRGMTVAFKLKGSRITVATALTHSSDHFCKKNGTKVAIGHFHDGKTVTLPLPKNRSRPVSDIKRLFRDLCW